MADDRNGDDGEIRSPREKKIRDAIVRPLFGDKVITQSRHVLEYCSHDYVTIVYGNMSQPVEVRCRQCKERIDPLLVLAHLARAWDNVTYAEQQLSELRSKLEELKREEANAKSRLRGARKKADNPRADEYFEELLRRIRAANTYTDRQEIQRWERSFKWLEPHHYSQLVDAWREAERRIEDDQRKRSKLRRSGLKELKGGADA